MGFNSGFKGLNERFCPNLTSKLTELGEGRLKEGIFVPLVCYETSHEDLTVEWTYCFKLRQLYPPGDHDTSCLGDRATLDNF
jgi:hypothetical protein